jgi:hypothetical protein
MFSFVQGLTNPLADLDYFSILLIINKTVMKIFIQVCAWRYDFIFCGQKSKSKIAGQCGRFMCNLLRNWQTVCEVIFLLHIPINSVWEFITPFPHQNLVCSILILSIVTGVPWYLIVVLIASDLCIFPCTYLLFISLCLSAMLECLFNSFDHNIIWF